MPTWPRGSVCCYAGAATRRNANIEGWGRGAGFLQNVTRRAISFTLERSNVAEIGDRLVNLNIELPDDLGAAVKEQAQAQGISPGRYVSRVLENTLGSARAEAQSGTFETGYGMWAKYGPAPSAEEIDENRRDMFRNFAKEL